jgi:hypothetical protein
MIQNMKQLIQKMNLTVLMIIINHFIGCIFIIKIFITLGNMKAKK